MGWVLRLLPAALLALTPGALAAQDGQFDLRTRASPTAAPEPSVVGPVDPDTPTVHPRPRAAPAIVLPTPLAQPSSAATAGAPAATPTATFAGRERTTPPPTARITPPVSSQVGSEPGSPSQPFPVAPSIAPSASATQPTPLPGPYQPRDLGIVSDSGGIGLWLGLATLALLLLGGGWLAWSRHFRHRARALPAPVVERPRATPAARTPTADEPQPLALATASGLHLALQATRMSATLVNTTLSYRLAVTNRGTHPLHDVRIAGDMISAHASRSASELLGAGAATLPELHRIATLAPGESVTLGGDIRLPLVSITPIRRGDAALFVPLARLRAHGLDPAGSTIAGGGTFLVGQEPGASKRLQPFRLDLGPRNYSRLGQQLLPAA